MTPDDLDVMARTIWGEARGQDLGGKIGVAWVIKNRADNPGWWGKGVADVCKQPWQFSCWNENDPNRQKLIGVTPQNEMFRDCLMVAAAVLTRNFPDPTHGANHYHAKGVSPDWAQGEEPTARIEDHIFYQL